MQLHKVALGRSGVLQVSSAPVRLKFVATSWGRSNMGHIGSSSRGPNALRLSIQRAWNGG